MGHTGKMKKVVMLFYSPVVSTGFYTLCDISHELIRGEMLMCMVHHVYCYHNDFYTLESYASVQLALASDKISSLQTPLLNLSLDVKENGALKPVSVEMNREELQTLISSMEAANKVNLQGHAYMRTYYDN
jgi:hypothetical protein